MEFETVIGLEVHAQLLTDTKYFAIARLNSAELPTAMPVLYASVCPVCCRY
jgi:Asp-tRNA(Asn)/Glu-tRNA(Gln) amidotransferase B subunit